jgi:hypothetical protein
MARRQRRAGAPKSRMIVESPIYVAMRDGVRVAVRVYRPDTNRPVPALFAASPYQYENDDVPHSPLFLTRETGPIHWYVEEQGYAYVRADTRGSGRSEGIFGLLDKAEQDDLYEVIEWIARQNWCDGNVGGIGQSYYAWTQWFMGIVNPPHLKCIAPYDGATDPYRGVVYHGGIHCSFLPNWYQGVRTANLHRAANLPGGADMPLDLALEMARHQTYDSWWRERTPHERLGDIKVPTFTIGHWGKQGLHLRGNVLAYEEIEAPCWLDVTGARDVLEAHDLFEQVSYHEKTLLPFYDRYLKGAKNGWEKRAPVRLFVRGAEEWRDETEWPLKRARAMPYYLNAHRSNSVTSLNDGGLSTSAPSRAGGATSYRYPDPRWRVGVVAFGPQGPDPVSRVLTFTSEPLASDLEVVGPIVAELYVSSDQIDTDVIVKLSDQRPQDAEARKAGRQPAATVVAKGWLRASHREKDAKRSTPYRPFYTHTDPQPITPGEVYRLDVEVMPCAHRFAKGNRIRLEIANGDSPLTDSVFNHPYLHYKVGRDTIHHSARYPSRLLLPVVPHPSRRGPSARSSG